MILKLFVYGDLGIYNSLLWFKNTQGQHETSLWLKHKSKFYKKRSYIAIMGRIHDFETSWHLISYRVFITSNIQCALTDLSTCSIDIIFIVN